MQATIEENKVQALEMIKHFSDSKLKMIIDFASCLKEKEASEELLRLQIGSRTYQDWLGTENDIYDEVFKDEVK